MKDLFADERSFSIPATRQPYSEHAVWLCENRKTQYKTRINGALAEILKKYPEDYCLRLLAIKEPPYEHIASAGE